jgi:hypothetical protein
MPPARHKVGKLLANQPELGNAAAEKPIRER